MHYCPFTLFQTFLKTERGDYWKKKTSNKRVGRLGGTRCAPQCHFREKNHWSKTKDKSLCQRANPTLSPPTTQRKQFSTGSHSSQQYAINLFISLDTDRRRKIDDSLYHLCSRDTLTRPTDLNINMLKEIPAKILTENLHRYLKPSPRWL